MTLSLVKNKTKVKDYAPSVRRNKSAALSSESTFNSSLGRKLKNLRKACEISQGDLGEYLGLHQTGICRIENGEQTLTPQQLHQISQLYGVKVDELIQADDLKYDLIAKRMKKSRS